MSKQTEAPGRGAETMSPTAHDITNGLLFELPRRFPMRAWRRNVFAAKIPDPHGGPARFVRSTQLPGEADITGILDISGIGCRVEIEVKAAKDSLRPAQKVFGDMIQRHGGIYIVARDVKATLAEVERRRAEMAARIGGKQ